MDEHKPLWSDDRFIAELSEHSSAHKNDWNAALELGRKIINEYEARLAAAEAELDAVDSDRDEAWDEVQRVHDDYTRLETRLAETERERDLYKSQAGLLEDNGRLVAWRMVNAEARVDELEQELTEAQVMLEPCLVCGRMREMESEDADNGE